jgi:hypothetical protein
MEREGEEKGRRDIESVRGVCMRIRGKIHVAIASNSTTQL